LNDSEKTDFGVAEGDKAGIEPFGAGNGHDSIFLEFARRGSAKPNLRRFVQKDQWRQECEGRQAKGAATFRLHPSAARIGHNLLSIFQIIYSWLLTTYSCYLKVNYY
jgi:hypothetical protein